MNIHKKFNRLAAGIGLGFAIGCHGGALAQTSVNPTIPPGSTPDYLPRIYERIINGSGNIAPSTSHIHSSITDIASLPDNDWLRHLQSLPPSEAHEEISSCFQTFCEHKYPLLTENEKFIARIIVIEAMFHDGLTPEEFRTYSEFISQYQPDHNFQQRDEALIDGIADKITRSPAYAALAQALVPAAQITSANAAEQYTIRKNFIDMVTHEIRSAYSMGAVTTLLDNFPQRLSSAAAYTISQGSYPELPTERAIIFNYAVSSTHNIESLIDLGAHETRHTMDFDNRSRAYRHEIAPDDPLFKHVAVINLNQNLYIPLCANNTHAAYSCPQQYEWYKNQYVERSAQDFSNKLVRKIREKLRALRPTETAPVDTTSFENSRRLEPQKLKLPA